MLQTPYKLISLHVCLHYTCSITKTERTVGSSAGVQHTAWAQVLVMGHVPSCPSTGYSYTGLMNESNAGSAPSCYAVLPTLLHIGLGPIVDLLQFMFCLVIRLIGR